VGAEIGVEYISAGVFVVADVPRGLQWCRVKQRQLENGDG